jgi:hypothetical protein
MRWIIGPRRRLRIRRLGIRRLGIRGPGLRSFATRGRTRRIGMLGVGASAPRNQKTDWKQSAESEQLHTANKTLNILSASQEIIWPLHRFPS